MLVLEICKHILHYHNLLFFLGRVATLLILNWHKVPDMTNMLYFIWVTITLYHRNCALLNNYFFSSLWKGGLEYLMSDKLEHYYVCNWNFSPFYRFSNFRSSFLLLAVVVEECQLLLVMRWVFSSFFFSLFFSFLEECIPSSVVF